MSRLIVIYREFTRCFHKAMVGLFLPRFYKGS